MDRLRGRAHRYPVTAYGLCNGLGGTTAEVIAALREGRSGLSAPPMHLPFETVCGVVRDLPSLPSAYAAFDSRIARITAVAVGQVHESVTRAVARWGAHRVAAVVGTSTGGLASTEDAVAEEAMTGQMPRGYDFDRQHPFHRLSELVCALTGIGGARYVVSAACASSAKAFVSARRLLDADVCDAVLVGGVDSLCQTTLRGFHSLGVLSNEACRPFGVARRGISIGEGGAFALLEKQGDGPALLIGAGETSDAYHMSSPDPTGAGAQAAMKLALAEARLSPGDLDYVNAHGTGTKLSDAAEARAISALLGNEVPVASTKGFTGHLLGAAGATEAIFAIVSIEHGFLPSSLGSEPVDPDIDVCIHRGLRAARVRTVLSNSFAFGGANASVLFGAAS
jgi:3-oxoacyl-[acyl-carrier-protein] synthase I